MAARGRGGAAPAARGRGGAPRGRGGFAPGRRAMIGGQAVSWETDPDLVIDDKARETYPPFTLPAPTPPTFREKAQVRLFLDMRDRIHKGPLYTVAGENVRVQKSRDPTKGKGVVNNPFSDMPSYTQKYKQKAKTLPDWSTRKYCLDLFPPELHDILDPTLKLPRSAHPNPHRPHRADLNDFDRAAREAEEAEAAGKTGEGAEGEDPDAVGEDGEPEEEDFSDQDSDMAADYNAEQYFDGGDEDDPEEEGGGGEDGGEY